ncbi:MAG: universal stress protein [Thermodesulfobacteriota bacterium]
MNEHAAGAPASKQERRLLLAVDGSENAQRAVAYVADFFASLPAVRATLLTIVPIPAGDYFANDTERATWVGERQEEARQMLATHVRILTGAGWPPERVATQIEVLEVRSIADRILEEQQRGGFCTVVIGRRGISRQEEFIFGSTSNRILHMAKDCAVLVVE